MDEQKKEVKAINPKRAAKNEALKVLKTFVDNSKDAKLIDALKVVKPSLYGIARGGGSGISGTLQKFLALVAERKQISEDDVFKALKIGRKEANQMIRKGLKKAAPDQRVWIKFDAAKGLYQHVATGKATPAGWEGFIPVEEATTVQK